MDMYIGIALCLVASSLPVGIGFHFWTKADERRQRDLNYREELRQGKFYQGSAMPSAPQGEGGMVENLIMQALSNPQVMQAILSRFGKKE